MKLSTLAPLCLAFLSFASHAQVGTDIHHFFLMESIPHLASKARALSPSEEAQSDVLNCTRNILRKGIEGYKGPEIAGTILSDILGTGKTLTQDPGLLKSSLEECEDVTLNGERQKGLDQKIILKNIDALKVNPKIKSFLTGVITQEKICISRKVSAEAAWFIGAGAGVHVLKCLQDDGTVKQFAGPSLKLVMGLGAMASFENAVSERKGSEGLVVGDGNALRISYTGESKYAAVLGTEISQGQKTYQNVGLARTDGIDINMGIRVFNGKHRWDLVIDAFNKN